MSNIYDLEGNNSEWLALASVQNYRGFSGNNFKYVIDKIFRPASHLNMISPKAELCYYGSRGTIFIK